jgi:hypothetical protein
MGKKGDGGAGAARAAAQANLEKAIKDIEALQIPDIEKQKLQLQLMSDAGFLEAEQLGREEEISVDPRLRQAQMDALSQLRERGQTGLTEEDKAVQDIMLRDVSAQEQAGQKAIMQGMAERGALDSGAQLAAQLGSQQSSYTRAANQASQNAIAAAEARRQALSQAGNMAQGMEATQFGQGQSERSYRQAIDQFNLANRQDIAAKNLGIRQQDVGLRNQQQMYNKALLQQDFENRKGVTAMKANARIGQATQQQQQADALARANAMKGSGLGSIAGMAAGAGLAYATGGKGSTILTAAGMGGNFGNQFFKDGGVVSSDNTGLEYVRRLINSGNQGDYIRNSLQDRNTDQSILDKLNTANNKRVQGAGFDYTDLPIEEQNDDYLNLQDRVKTDLQSTDKNKLLDELEMLYNNKLQNGGMAKKYYSDGSGDIVPGDSYSGDRVDAKLNSKEMVLNVPQQQRLMDVIRGEEDLTALGNEDIIEGVPESYRNKLHGKDKKSTTAKGFKKLLEILGE